jgi:hypothetical protein
MAKASRNASQNGLSLPEAEAPAQVEQPTTATHSTTASVTIESDSILVRSEVIFSSQTDAEKNPSLVDVIATYPDGWTGDRHWLVGNEYSVDAELAVRLVERGLAKLKE